MRHALHPSLRAFVLAMLLTGLLLAACGGPSTPPAAEAPAGEPAPSSPEPVGDTPAAPEDDPSGQPGEESGSEVIVFAASSLTNAFDALAAEFEAQNPDVQVVLNYASSLQLATQLAEGAQADVFASANEQQMASAVSAGRIELPTATFATNRLTIIVPEGNPGNVTSVAALAQEGVRFVTAVPGVPIRDYTNQMLEQMAADPTFGPVFVDAVYGNLASEESSVRQVVAKIELGEADAAVVYVSDVAASPPDAIDQIEIPEEYNVIASYPVGLTTDAPNRDLGAAFIEFVLSEQGQAILAEWGFEPAAGG
ncbi:MAG TPA: molybdate ABC transporter substrate-binding protein [Aggregatilineales bacterium]|nr:molybdate ABC transporter substrate-binding protein [Aggregatilineales bacterium]